MFDRKDPYEERMNLIREMIHFTVMGTGSSLEKILDQPKRFEVGKLVRVDGEYTLNVYDKLSLDKIPLRISRVMAENDRFYELALEATERGKEPSLVQEHFPDYEIFSRKETPNKDNPTSDRRMQTASTKETSTKEWMMVVALGVCSPLIAMFVSAPHEAIDVLNYVTYPISQVIEKHQEVLSFLPNIEDEHGDSLPFRLGL